MQCSHQASTQIRAYHFYQKNRRFTYPGRLIDRCHWNIWFWLHRAGRRLDFIYSLLGRCHQTRPQRDELDLGRSRGTGERWSRMTSTCGPMLPSGCGMN